MTGRTLGHYRIVARLGRGGMGAVYVAEDLKLRRRVALKVLPADVADAPRRLERFQREAESIARLNHPNIVTAYSTEEVDGVSFITMELVEGRSLDVALPADGLELERFLAWAEQIADALTVAHEKGIIHRDLKPANIMVTDRGQIKVLDFGLAKIEEDPSAPFDSEAPTQAATREGSVVGTLPYMSPEQLEGSPVDARSDIFSLGLVMFEMLAGRPAFRGDSRLDRAASILRDDTPSLTDLKPDLPRHLGRILAGCLEKNPERRMQSAKELRNQLAALRSELETGQIRAVLEESVRQQPVGWARRAVAGRFGWPLIPVLLLLVLSAVAWLVTRGDRPSAGVGSPPVDSLAVLHFHNLIGDPELDWLSRGLSEMLITDLSQVPELRLVGTERLHSLLSDLDALGGEPLGAETVAELAQRAAVDTVLVGSFANVGDELRITARLQDAATGEILDSRTVSDRGQDRIFSLADSLGSQLRTSLIATEHGVDRPIEQVLTASVEAFRLYTEGRWLHGAGRDREAIAYFEAAIEKDPGFSMALVRLATASANLGQRDQARRYTQQALEGADRLPPRYRYYVEARYYGSEWETYGQAIEAYRRAIAADPHRRSSRNLLAMIYLSLERYAEAFEQYRELVAGGDSFAFTYHALGVAHATQDRWQEGYDELARFVERQPENWLGHWALGWHLSLWGRLEEADAVLGHAEELHEDDYFLPLARWQAATLAEDFERADVVAGEQAAVDDSAVRYRGLMSLATNRMFRGQARAALELLADAREVIGPGADRAFAHNLSAELLLALGDAEGALREAAAARLEGDRRWPERRAIYLAALAEESLGRSAAATELLSELERRHSVHPNRYEARQIVVLKGLLAGLRDDAAAERAALLEAESMLAPRGVAYHPFAVPDHATVWLELGRSQLGAGEAESAVVTLTRLADGLSERADSPIAYGRALYLLGKAHADLGQADEASRHLERFLGLWRGGDLDRAWVSDAERLLAGAG